MISAFTRHVNEYHVSKHETGGWKTVRNNNKAGTQHLTEKLSEDIMYFLKCFSLEAQGYNYCTELDIVLLIKYFGVFGGGTRLAMSKTIYTLDTSSLKPGSRATEGVLD